MNIQINGWDDNYNFIRKQIIRDVINIMYSFFKNEMFSAFDRDF